jgi:putative transposase
MMLRQRLQLLARRHPRYGYRRIHALLRREGWPCNRKRVQRLWRDEGLRLPAKTRRRRRGPRMPGHLTAACPDQVWAIDFVSDRTADGRPLKILTVTDEHTREALAPLLILPHSVSALLASKCEARRPYCNPT